VGVLRDGQVVEFVDDQAECAHPLLVCFVLDEKMHGPVVILVFFQFIRELLGFLKALFDAINLVAKVKMDFFAFCGVG
jgi:hypothetical protein